VFIYTLKLRYTTLIHQCATFLTQFHSSLSLSFDTQAVRRVDVASRQYTVTVSAAYICIDCGYIYEGSTAFEKLPNSYKCPTCQAPKRRFKPWSGGGGSKNDQKSMTNRMKQLKSGGGGAAAGSEGGDNTVVFLAGGAMLLVALYFGLNSYFN